MLTSWGTCCGEFVNIGKVATSRRANIKAYITQPYRELFPFAHQHQKVHCVPPSVDSSGSKMDWPKDDFKWFGQGFDGFPKSLPEDCVEYALYIIDSKLSDFDVREKLREVQSEANRLTEQLLEGFIWQRESFALDLIRGNGKVQSFLGGRTNYGDSVNDEWLIVHILREISKRFPHLWIRVVDTDGQFLLIEAANALPRWLNPEIADFRVRITLELEIGESKLTSRRFGSITGSS